MLKRNHLVKNLSYSLVSRSSSTVSMPKCSVEPDNYTVNMLKN